MTLSAQTAVFPLLLTSAAIAEAAGVPLGQNVAFHYVNIMAQAPACHANALGTVSIIVPASFTPHFMTCYRMISTEWKFGGVDTESVNTMF